jgi:hypothetical protein
MEVVSQTLYLVIFVFAVYGGILLLSRRRPPPGWKPETYEKSGKSSKSDPFRQEKPDSFLNKKDPNISIGR